MSKDQLQAMSLLAAPEPEPASARQASGPHRYGPSQYRHPPNKAWPAYSRSLAGAPPNRDNTGPVRSMADFSWCMTAIDCGWSIEETAAKLLEVSERAELRKRQRDDGYALITAQNAAAAVEGNDRKRGRG